MDYSQEWAAWSAWLRRAALEYRERGMAAGRTP